MLFLFIVFIRVCFVYTECDSCVVYLKDHYNQPVICGDYAGAQCPDPSSPCIPGRDYGHCCLGCGPGNGPPIVKCETRCGLQFCIFFISLWMSVFIKIQNKTANASIKSLELFRCKYVLFRHRFNYSTITYIII